MMGSVSRFRAVRITSRLVRLVTEALREFTGEPNALEPTLPTRATGRRPDTASGLVGVLDLGVEVALGGA